MVLKYWVMCDPSPDKRGVIPEMNAVAKNIKKKRTAGFLAILNSMPSQTANFKKTITEIKVKISFVEMPLVLILNQA